MVIVKNYLTEPEIAGLDRLTTMFLDFAEDRAERRLPTLMADWVAQTDRFLAFNEREALNGPGTVSASSMKAIAAERYAEFDGRRRALEAEHAANEELDDLRALTAIENRRMQRDGRATAPSTPDEDATSDVDRGTGGREK